MSQKMPDRHEVFLAARFFPALVTECDVGEGEGRYIWSQLLFTKMSSEQEKSPRIKQGRGEGEGVLDFLELTWLQQSKLSFEFSPPKASELDNDKWVTAVPWPSESQLFHPCVDYGTWRVCFSPPPRPDRPDSGHQSLDSATIWKAVAQAFPDTVEQLEAFNCLGNLGVPQMRN